VRTTRNGYAPRTAERVAREIELDIVARGLTAGDSLGSEADLMERYRVSRGVIREAVTLVEHHMQAETRRGAGGGLIVVEPSVRVIAEMASLYLARKHVSVTDVFRTRVYLEIQAVEDIITSLNAEKAGRLRAEASRADPGRDLGPEAEQFHLLLAELSGNPVLDMLLPILSGLISDVWSAQNPRPPAKMRKALWQEISDLTAARGHLTAHLTTSHKSLARGAAVLTARGQAT
jgi:DNA-binding FadR family transcriptional regulator